MLGDMNSLQEKAVLGLMVKITSIRDLNTLLNVVVKELPDVVGAIGCWIYLQPDYVPEYTGSLNRGEKELSEADLTLSFDDFIVLAATNLEPKKSLIGRAFFGAGEGITGWVYKNGRPLRINDVVSEQELKTISSDLYWANEYHDSDELYQPEDKRPLLVAPLILNNNSIGVLKFSATKDQYPFSEISQEIAVIVSQIIAGAIRQTRIVAEQNRAILQLVETSNKNTPLEVIADVTSSMKEMLNCVRAEFYIQSEDGATLRLAARNGLNVAESETIESKRGEGLIGWVYKTGLPIIIPNIKKYTTGLHLDDALLEKISSGDKINDEDRHLDFDEDDYSTDGKLQAVSFIAAPVKSKNKEVRGVLCGYRNISVKSRFPFERSELTLATSFASTIAFVLDNERQRMLGNLLVEIGNLTQTDQLFKVVTNNIPNLVASSGCSIFTSILRQGTPFLKLTSTSQKGLTIDNGKIPNIEYELGEAKTGMCGLFQAPLVANHYGNGKVSIDRIDQEIARIGVEHPNNIASVLIDNSDNKVGLFQLLTEDKLPIAKRVAISDFAKTIVFQSTGLTSQQLDNYIGKQWSFVGVPISTEDSLLGVITLSRPTPETPFSDDDVSLLKSIAGRLASVMSNLRILERRQQLLLSLAHEINTPLTGILADSQNIRLEASGNADLQKLAEHNLGQVLRLHMQASAIMSVLSELKSSPQFTKHSIFRPLKEACELFKSEAAQNGCDIVGPRTLEGDFPEIEMSLFDLTIAFKNIIHNAIKYSFRPPANLDTSRVIKVWGQRNKAHEGHYDIFIQNYGVGISPLEIETRLIFEPYYRGSKASDRRRTGSGFGLAHARLVIEDIHHGLINVTSVHQGADAYLTTFTISLPIKQPK
jgi:signal transduction histidine kinase